MPDGTDHDLLIELKTLVNLTYQEWRTWKAEQTTQVATMDTRLRLLEAHNANLPGRFITTEGPIVQRYEVTMVRMERYMDEFPAEKRREVYSWVNTFRTKAGVYGGLALLLWGGLVTMAAAWIAKH